MVRFRASEMAKLLRSQSEQDAKADNVGSLAQALGLLAFE